MLHPVTEPVAHRRATPAGYACLAIVLSTYVSAGWMAVVQWTEGPPAQRVNIRWAADVSPDQRRQAEREFGLAAGDAFEGRTWRYFLRKRSGENIEQLLKDRRVEDTFHIDRTTLRVQIDKPDLSPRFRTWLESDRLGEISLFLAIVATAFSWYARARLLPALHRTADSFAWLVAKAFDPRRENVRPTARELTIATAFGILFLIPLLLYGPYEEEIVQATVLPNQVFYKELFHGRWIYWLNDLGFGAPMPLGDPLMFHPVFGPLAAFSTLRVTLTAVWLAQMVVMVVYFLKLLAVTDVRLPSLRLLLAACCIASAPSTLYFYDSDWLQMVIAWTLYPVLVFYLHAAITSGAREHFWRTALSLGLLFGFWIVNAHPGYVMTSALAFAVYVLVAAPHDRRVYMCLTAGATLAAGIASARVYMLLHEARLFPATASALRDGTNVHSYVAAFVAPLLRPDVRAPFIGVGVGSAAIASLLWLTRREDSHVRGCTAALFASAVFSVIPGELWFVPAFSPWLFRDPVVFFGLLAGGNVLQRAFRAPQPAFKYAAALLLLLQLVQQWYVVPRASLAESRRRAGKLLFYRYQGQPFGLGRTLVDEAKRFGRRVYLSPQVDTAMHGNLSADGIHFSSDLVLLGLNPVNGWFKNVSVTVIQPPKLLMEGTIQGDSNVIGNRTLLDVLGINLVLTTEHETGVPPGVVVVDRPDVNDERLSDLVLLANADAWPPAVLLRGDAYTTHLPVRTGCERTGALCRDYEPLSQMRIDGDVTLHATNGTYVAHVPPSDQERVLFISAMYRPEWRAAGPTGPLPVHAIADAFLGVTVPPGTTDITVEYTPRIQIALTWFSNIVFGGGLAILVIGRRRRTARGITSDMRVT